MLTLGMIQIQLLLGTVLLSPVIASPVAEADYPWPNGLYCLPMADTQTGCHVSKTGIPWESGYRVQDTETFITPFIGGNEWSSPCHLLGPLGKLSMTWNFCSKTDTSDDPNPPVEWGPGKYCILKLGTTCPAGFDEGSIQWDDEDGVNLNDKGGTLPEGVYDRDTLIYFCCREDGTTVAPIYLPTSKPFILFMKEMSNCQNVDGMVDSEEWFRWDGENSLIDFTRYFSGSVPYHDGYGNNHKIHFCYYVEK